jgi:hypothetical protein
VAAIASAWSGKRGTGGSVSLRGRIDREWQRDRTVRRGLWGDC